MKSNKILEENKKQMLKAKRRVSAVAQYLERLHKRSRDESNPNRPYNPDAD